MRKKVYVPCKYCGETLERERIQVAVCFNCKKKRYRKHGVKYQQKRKQQRIIKKAQKAVLAKYGILLQYVYFDEEGMLRLTMEGIEKIKKGSALHNLTTEELVGKK